VAGKPLKKATLSQSSPVAVLQIDGLRPEICPVQFPLDPFSSTSHTTKVSASKDLATMKSVPDQGFSGQEYGGDIQRITAFLPKGAEPWERQGSGGNPCQLLILTDNPDRVAPSISGITECQSWPTIHNGKTAITVSCFTAGGQAIQCCGHGLLAAAHSWQQRLQCSELSLLMTSSRLQCWREQE
jgi:hypothetical protein